MKDAKTKSGSSKPRNKRRYTIITVAAILAVLVILDLSPFGGNARFYATWIRCKEKPVATAGSSFMNSGAMYYYEPSSLPGMHPSIDYFCTPLEAERAGYSASPNQYEFPHLKRG